MNIDQNIETWVRLLTFAPLIVCSITAVALILGKWLDLRPSRVRSDEAIQAAKGLLASGDSDGALRHLSHDRSHAARLVSRLIPLAQLPAAAIDTHASQIEEDATREVEDGLDGLSLIAMLGPLFGLLGTVVGIVVVFNVLASADAAASPQELAGGIGTALYTTIVGLVVGITALVAHRALSAKADRVVAMIEKLRLEIVDLIETLPAGEAGHPGTLQEAVGELR